MRIFYFFNSSQALWWFWGGSQENRARLMNEQVPECPTCAIFIMSLYSWLGSNLDIQASVGLKTSISLLVNWQVCKLYFVSRSDLWLGLMTLLCYKSKIKIFLSMRWREVDGYFSVLSVRKIKIFLSSCCGQVYLSEFF